MENGEKRITIWQKSQGRKISGNAAPKQKNLSTYLTNNPDCEIYQNQDKRRQSSPRPQSDTNTQHEHTNTAKESDVSGELFSNPLHQEYLERTSDCFWVRDEWWRIAMANKDCELTKTISQDEMCWDNDASLWMYNCVK
eukprot:c7485_g1_i1.p2 GENE.c7485_g1_i1~~c7485_g1_i1.p2  ORF type:complete len:139 (+),score=19.84 c7485_g1_i1:83-499(+)